MNIGESYNYLAKCWKKAIWTLKLNYQLIEMVMFNGRFIFGIYFKEFPIN